MLRESLETGAFIANRTYPTAQFALSTLARTRIERQGSPRRTASRSTVDGPAAATIVCDVSAEYHPSRIAGTRYPDAWICGLPGGLHPASDDGMPDLLSDPDSDTNRLTRMSPASGFGQPGR